LTSDSAIYAIATLASLGVVARPWRFPEATWAVADAGALVLFGLLPWTDAAQAAMPVALALDLLCLLAQAAVQGLFTP
jgi:arsenical pump membrane protein